MITIIPRAASFPLKSHQRGHNLVRVRRTSHGKSQPGPIVVHFTVATPSDQWHGEDGTWQSSVPVQAVGSTQMEKQIRI